MKHTFTGITLATLVAAATALPAVTAHGTTVPTKDRGSLIQSEQAKATSAGQALGLGANEKLVVKDVIDDADGTSHVRYNRTFNGLRVVGGDFVAHRDKAGAIASVTWNASGKAAVASTTPKVSAATATAKGKAQGLSKASAPQGELVVYAGGSAPVLAYDVLSEGVRADKVPSRLHTIIDANSGAKLTSWDEIQTGEGHGIFVGDVEIGTTSGASGFELRDEAGNVSTDVHNEGDANTGEGPAGDVFTDADDVWGTGANSDRASAAVDAQYGAEKTFDYYKNTLGRNGIWDDGKGAPSRVHFADGMVNAFWDGTQMSYGDGEGNNAPLVELDVAGHEMSHGVTENTAGLAYSGDAGGLNEATSDIFGTSVEWYANNANDVPDYLIGEEVDINGDGTPLRYMDEPSKDGASKDCWSSSLGGLDPHYSSGPLNHWFYLASEGSGAKTINGVSYDSPTCDSSTVTGVGREKVEKVWYKTLSTYLTTNSTYGDARDGAIKSAKELYADDATVCQGISASFDAIDVPAGTESCS